MPTGNLCERIQPKLTGSWTIGSPEPRLYGPLSDACLLTDTARKAHQIQLALSATPVTDAQSAVLRRDDAASVAGWYAAKVIDGGAGTTGPDPCGSRSLARRPQRWPWDQVARGE